MKSIGEVLCILKVQDWTAPKDPSEAHNPSWGPSIPKESDGQRENIAAKECHQARSRDSAALTERETEMGTASSSSLPSLSQLYSKRVLLLRLPILIGPDTDRLVRSTEYQGGSLTGLPSSHAIQMAPSSLLTKEQGTQR